MGKGEITRQAILERASGLASVVGLEGLTIGRLAEELDLSKSGLFAHFRSKEALQVQVLRFAADQFVEAVIRPALSAPRGEPRVRALFENWVRWARASTHRCGCLFVAASTEMDDRPGPARDELVRLQKDWMEFMAQAYRVAVAEGHFRSDGDPDQFAYEMHALMLGWHHAARLLRDQRAEQHARTAFESLVRAARRPVTSGANTRRTRKAVVHA